MTIGFMKDLWLSGFNQTFVHGEYLAIIQKDCSDQKVLVFHTRCMFKVHERTSVRACSEMVTKFDG